MTGRCGIPEFTCDVVIEADVDCVYGTLTTAQGLSRWWGHTIDSDLVVGSTAEFLLGAARVMRIRIVELTQPSLVSWTCVGGVGEWERSSLRFELKALGGTTLLRFTHRGWQWRFAAGELAAANFSWPRHLIRLRELAPYMTTDVCSGRLL